MEYRNFYVSYCFEKNLLTKYSSVRDLYVQISAHNLTEIGRFRNNLYNLGINKNIKNSYKELFKKFMSVVDDIRNIKAEVGFMKGLGCDKKIKKIRQRVYDLKF